VREVRFPRKYEEPRRLSQLRSVTAVRRTVRRHPVPCSPSPHHCVSVSRVGNFRQKNNSAEDGIGGTNGYFRRNSGCSAEQKTSEFRSEPFRGRKQLGIPFRGTKIKAKSHYSVPNPSVEENTTRNSVPWNQNKCKFSEFRSELFRGREHNSEFRSVQPII
jgi:hypothetical protein